MFLSGHCCDEGGPLPTAFLRGQEGDGTLGGQIFDGVFQNSGETRIIKRKIILFVACCVACRIKLKCERKKHLLIPFSSFIILQLLFEKNSLWMQLVEGPVHPHRDVQTFQSAVLSDFIHHGRHA